MYEAEWLKSVGWKEMPFNASDTTIDKDLIVGFEDIKDEMEKHIANGKNYFVFLYGPVGAGKTTLLNWLEKEEKGKARSIVIKFSSPPTKEEIVEHINYLFEPRMSLISRITSIFRTPVKLPRTIHDVPSFLDEVKGEKKVLFLIDEVEKVKRDPQMEEGLNELKNVMEATKSITILAGLPESINNLTESMRSRIQHKRMVRKMGADEIIALVNARIAAFGKDARNPFTGDALQAVYTQSSGAPRYAIKVCDLAVRYAIRDGRPEVTLGDVIQAHTELGQEESYQATESMELEKKDDKPGLKEEMINDSFLGKLAKSELQIVQLLHRKPSLTVDEIAKELGITSGTVYNQLAALQGKKRVKPEVPYPLLLSGEKDGKLAYSLKDHVERYLAEA